MAQNKKAVSKVGRKNLLNKKEKKGNCDFNYSTFARKKGKN